MNRNSNNGFLFSLGIVFCILFIAYLAWSGLIFDEYNWQLTSVITILLVFSILSLIRLWTIMNEQENQIDKVFQKEFSSIDDIKTIIISLKDSLIKERLVNIDKTYEQSNKVNYTDIEYLTMKRQRNYGTIEKYIINATILIGWVGTFLGIIQSVKHLNITSTNASMPMIEGIIGGLSLAIGSSILGISSSLFLGFLYTAYKNYENNVFIKLEEISILKIVPNYSIIENSLISKAIVDSMNRVLPSIIKQSTDDLKEATLNLKDVTEEIKYNQKNFSTLITQIEVSVLNATENNQKIQILLGAFNGHISKLNPTLDRIDDVIIQNNHEFEKIIVENKANFDVISKTYSSLKSHSDTLKTFTENLKNDFSTFLINASTSNNQYKEVLSESFKLLVTNQAETSNKLLEAHNKFVRSIDNIEKKSKMANEIKKEKEENSIISELKKRSKSIFSILKRLR